MEEVYQKLLSILKVYVFNKEVLENIGPETSLTEDLKINSARIVDIVLDAEDVFDIEIENEAFEGIATISDITALIERKLEEKKSA